MKTDNYICLDEATGEWQEASYAQLVDFNEPELKVCQVDDLGNVGPEMFFREVLASKEAKNKKKASAAPLPPSTEADILFEIQMQEQMERLITYRHVRRCCSILVGLGVAAVIPLDGGNLLGLALIIALVFHIVFASAPAMIKRRKK